MRNNKIPAILLGMSTDTRIVPVDDDAMEPTLYRGDAVIAAPVETYCGEGLYVVDIGYPRLYRVQVNPATGALVLRSDNRAYPSSEWPMEEFSELVMAKVGATVRVLDPHLIS